MRGVRIGRWGEGGWRIVRSRWGVYIEYIVIIYEYIVSNREDRE